MKHINEITVIHHSADFDGLFCREIARKFLGDSAEYIGWDFGDAPLDSAILHASKIVVMDLPVDRVFGLQFKDGWICRGDEQVQPIDRWDSSTVTWIDHHKSSIETHPKDLPGYRIDGVSACRLAWQWFTFIAAGGNHPSKEHFEKRLVTEPYAVQLAGEYDIWDKRNPDTEAFQFGLRSVEAENLSWARLLTATGDFERLYIDMLLSNGRLIQRYQQDQDASIVKAKSFQMIFEGLNFLCLNSPRFNSLTFAALDVPATGHDALLGFVWDGKGYNVSLYHARHNTSLDLSLIAKKFGGGGHRGACGFISKELPFTLQ